MEIDYATMMQIAQDPEQGSWSPVPNGDVFTHIVVRSDHTRGNNIGSASVLLFNVHS